MEHEDCSRWTQDRLAQVGELASTFTTPPDKPRTLLSLFSPSPTFSPKPVSSGPQGPADPPGDSKGLTSGGEKAGVLSGGGARRSGPWVAGCCSPGVPLTAP